MESVNDRATMASAEERTVKTSIAKNLKFIFLLFLIPIAVFVFSFGIGRYFVHPEQVIQVIWAKLTGGVSGIDAGIETVLLSVRLPRLIAAILVGSALSAAGCAYQGMFRNPLVSPDVLGATAGAAFGAALGIYMSLGIIQIQIMSFACGLVAVVLAYLISLKIKKDPVLILVLSGILLGTVFTSGTSFLKYIADPYDKLPAITFWLMGSLSRITMKDLTVISGPVIVGISVLLLFRWRLNVMTLGEDEAKSLGINTNIMRFVTITASTAVTAAVVSVSGQIGWVGLVVPHLARLLVGPDFRKLLPVSVVMGAAYLMLVDDIARSIALVEIPLGILTSVVGAPFFLFLILKDGRS